MPSALNLTSWSYVSIIKSKSLVGEFFIITTSLKAGNLKFLF